MILGDGLKDTLGQVNAWIMSAMGLVMTIVPIIPFISILSTVAKGDGATLLKGWEFIVASYAIAIICGAAKLIIVCTRFKLKLPVIWKKLWPMIATAFASANNSTMLKTEYVGTFINKILPVSVGGNPLHSGGGRSLVNS